MEEKGKYDAQKRYEAKNVVKVLLRLNKKPMPTYCRILTKRSNFLLS